MVVDAATGWAINDWIMIADTGSGAAFQGDLRQITSVAGTTIGFAALTNAHADRAMVGNLTRNVFMRPHNTANPFQFRINLTSLGVSSTGVEGRYEFGYSAFEDMGVTASNTDAWLIDTRDQQLASAPTVRLMEGMTSYVTNLTGTALGNIDFFNTAGVYNPYPIDKVVVCGNNSNGNLGRAGFRVNNASVDVTDSWVLSGGSGGISFISCPYGTWTGGGSSVGGGGPLYL